MSLVEINPWSWTYGFPFALAFLSIYFAPMQSRIKVGLKKIAEFEAGAMATIFFTRFEFSEEKAHRQTQMGSLIACVAIAALSLVSFVKWLG